MTTVPEAYLAVAVMALVGIGFPVVTYIATAFLRPRKASNEPNMMRSWLLPGYETDQSLYIRRDSTYECGAEPVGDAHINFHFQYYWYAIIFLVFDIAFMFLAFGGGNAGRHPRAAGGLRSSRHSDRVHRADGARRLARLPQARQNLHLR